MTVSNCALRDTDRGVLIKTARDVESTGFFASLPGKRFESVTLSNVNIEAMRPLDATNHTPTMAQ